MNPKHSFVQGDLPLIATAIHDSHYMRPDLQAISALSPADRNREEDPYTGWLASVFSSHIIVGRSRFEADLNRPPSGAVYQKPEDAWGLDLWKTPPTEEQIQESMAYYDQFYAKVYRRFRMIEQEFGSFLVLDLHSYNHRRDGASAEPADPLGNPEVNVGTGSMDANRWGVVKDRFMEAMREIPVKDHTLDVRENVRFDGGHFSRWIHSRFPDSGCCLAIEFKKTFMDEWTGVADIEWLRDLRRALEHAGLAATRLLPTSSAA